MDLLKFAKGTRRFSGLVLLLVSIIPGGLADAEESGKAVGHLREIDKNGVSGSVVFTQIQGSVQVEVQIRGLTPERRFPVHLHQWGDCSGPHAWNAGGHFEPSGKSSRRLPRSAGLRHAGDGDLGTGSADQNGVMVFKRNYAGITVDRSPSSIIGRTVVVHVGIEWLACGVIGWKKP
jgi:Cu-Zn family superoxide dismutase